MQGGVPILSWIPAPGATRYEIFRATYHRAKDANVRRAQNAPVPPENARRLGVPELPYSTPPDDAWIAGDYNQIGTTTETFFQDRSAKDDIQYAYYVQSAGRGGDDSASSNMVIVPSLAPVTTFDLVESKIKDLADHGQIKDGAVDAHRKLLSEGKSAAAAGDLPGARGKLEALNRQVNQNPGNALDTLAAEDLDLAVSSLTRRVRLAEAGVLTLEGVPQGQPTLTPTATSTSTSLTPTSTSTTPTPTSTSTTPTPAPQQPTATATGTPRGPGR